MEHELIIVHSVGDQTGLALQQATCSCGWRACVRYAGFTRVEQSYQHHLAAVERERNEQRSVA